MSTKSVFKFSINNNSEAKAIVDNFLNRNGFNYNSEHQCYVIGTPSEEDANKNMVGNVASTLQANILNTTPTRVVALATNIHQCLEYEIIGNQLIIKAYILNAFSNSKAYIHSSINSNMAAKQYYKDLQNDLFNELEKNNITFVNVETEKVSDGSGSKLFKKTFLIVLPVIIVFAIIAVVSYVSNN